MDIRIPKLVNQLEKIYNQLTLYDTPLQEIHTPTKTALRKLQSVAQNIVDFTSNYMGIETNTDTTSADTVTTDDSDISQDVYEILCNTEDYAIATYGIGEELKDQMAKLSDQIEDIRCLVKDDYPVVQRTPNISSDDIYNLVVSTITDCMQHIAINIKHTETKTESIHIIEKHY